MLKVEEKTKKPCLLTSENALLLLSAVITILVATWIIKYSAYGFDFTDESFYLAWISNPWIYDFSLTQFGYIYHPLYLLVDGDIASLRKINTLITFILAWNFSNTALHLIKPDSETYKKFFNIISAGLAISSLILLNSWLLTPNYNSLALQALLISTTGLLMADNKVSMKSTIGWLIIGLGGWLAFMAKPSTAAALALCSLIYLLIARKISTRNLIISMASALLLTLVTSFVIDDGPLQFARRLILGSEFGQYLGGGHTLTQILRIDRFHLGIKNIAVMTLFFASSLIATIGLASEKPSGKITSILISLAACIWVALVTLNITHKHLELGEFQGLITLSITFSCIVAFIYLSKFKNVPHSIKPQWSAIFLLLVMPYVYAFGTNGNYWSVGAAASIFWILSGVILLTHCIRGRSGLILLLPITITTQVTTAVLLQTGMEQPYRQPQPLRVNKSQVEVGTPDSTLTLSSDYAKYINDAKSIARKANFAPGTALIDLSGQSPGLLYALQAQNIGQAWMIGGYPGSANFARASLERLGCEKIATAWILIERNGPRSIPTDVINGLGIQFPEDYQLMGTWSTAAGAGGYVDIRLQELYKPREKTKIIDTCLSLRRSKP